MRAIFYHGMPVDVYMKKANDPQKSTITGAVVYMSDVLPALLKYGTFDRYYLPELPWKGREEALSVPEIAANLHRIKFVPEHLQYTMSESKSLILVSPGPGLRWLARIRNRMKWYDSPITGVLHSLNYRSFMEDTLLEMLSPLQPFDALFAGSQAGAEVLKRRVELVARRYSEQLHIELEFPPKLILLPPGVNEESFGRRDSDLIGELRKEYSVPIEAKVVLYFGRFSPVSKADLFPLILAFSQLPYAQQSIILVLAGDDTLLHIATDLISFARELGCAEHVRVLPNPLNDEKLKLYKIADIFVSPSDCIQETFGLTIIEAMAASLPVIASDWNGYRDIVVHDETGFLIPTLLPEYSDEFDDLHGSGAINSDDLLARTTVVSIPHLVQALLSLTVNAGLRRRMGNAGRDLVVQSFGWRQVVRRYEETWENLIAEARSRQRGPASGRAVYDTYSYKEVFDHYATRYLTLEDEIALSEIGASIGAQQSFLDRVATPKDRFSVELFQIILTKLAHVSTLPVREILLAISALPDGFDLRPLDSRMIVLVHLARLLKFGILEIRESRSVKNCAESIEYI